MTECETFGRFARLLAKEWREWRYVEQKEKTEAQASVKHLTPFSLETLQTYTTLVCKGAETRLSSGPQNIHRAAQILCSTQLDATYYSEWEGHNEKKRL